MTLDLFCVVANSTIFQASGTAQLSFTSTLLEGKRLSEEEEFDLKWSAASLYSGISIIPCMRASSNVAFQVLPIL